MGKQQEQRQHGWGRRYAALHTSCMCLTTLCTCMVAIVAAADQQPAMYVASDGVLHIGSNESNTHVHVAGIDIHALQQRVRMAIAENSMLKAENSHVYQLLERLDRPDWQEIRLEYKLTASDAAVGADFGSSVCVDGGLLFVGADGAANSAGAVYLFEKKGVADAFGQVNKLAASDANAGDDFGSSVFVDGDLLFVGATGDDDKGTNSGSVYVFEKNSISGVFEERYKLTASDAATSHSFGQSVSVDGDLLFVGATGDNSNSGSVYVFEKSGISGVFEQKYKLTAHDAASGDRFGQSVSVDGDLLFVGAYGDDNKGANSGSVYVFEKHNVSGRFEETYIVTASDAVSGDLFGGSVSVDGDLLFVGADGVYNKGTNSGAVYVFEKNVATRVFEEKHKLTASDAASGDRFGSSVSVDGHLLVVGATGDDDRYTNSGSVYVYSLPLNSVSQ